MERKTKAWATMASVLMIGMLVSSAAGGQPGYAPGPTQGFPAPGGRGQGTWVLVTYDYNGDGQVDAYQYIYSTDLYRAIVASRQRPGGVESTMLRRYYGPGSQGLPAAQYGAGVPLAGPGQMRQVIGIVQDTRQVRLAQRDQVHLFAKVQPQQGGLVVVDLGPVYQVRRLNITPGTYVQTSGDTALVNNRPVVMANQVSANGRTIKVYMPQGSLSTRLQGQMVNLAARRLEGGSRPVHMVAMLRLNTGRTVPVDLGRQDNLRDVRLQTGDNVIVLARPVPIGDKMILVAQQLSVAGRIIDEPWLTQFADRRQQQARAR